MAILTAVILLAINHVNLVVFGYLIDFIGEERFNCEDEKTGKECPICRLDEMEWAVETGCRHRFCYECLTRWLEKQEREDNVLSCPLCRTEVTTISRIGWKTSVTWWKTIAKSCYTAVWEFCNTDITILLPENAQDLYAFGIRWLSRFLMHLILHSLFALYGLWFNVEYNYHDKQWNNRETDETQRKLEKLGLLLIIYKTFARSLKKKFTAHVPRITN